MWRRSAAAGAIMALLAGVANAEPAVSQRQPSLRPALDTVEAGLWSEMDKAEAHVQRSAERDADPALNRYVHDVMCRLAPEYCAELRVYILSRPVFNATAAPNGYLEVWSGAAAPRADRRRIGLRSGP